MIIMRGLPASGKSTRAKEIMARGGEYFRINRDLLREMLHFNKWTPKNEKLVVKVATRIAREVMKEGFNVIIDDTNLTKVHVYQWSQLAVEFGATVEVVDMTKEVSVEMCIARDAERISPVGRQVIMEMAIKNGIVNLGNIVVCDIDGTVSDPTHRLEYARGPKKDWGTFFSLMYMDLPRKEVFQQVINTAEAEGAYIVYVSARPEKYRQITEDWLRKHNMHAHIHLFMRKDGDKREDTLVKGDIYKNYLSKCNVVEVFDDRPSVIRMWREKGLNVTDVGQGIEF